MVILYCVDYDWFYSVFSNDGYFNYSFCFYSWLRCVISGEKGNLKYVEIELFIFVIKDCYYDMVIDDYCKKYVVV